MFRTLARLFVDPTLATPGSDPAVLTVHPLQLSRWLDEAWEAAAIAPNFAIGDPDKPFLGEPGIVNAIRYPLGAPVLPAGLSLPPPNPADPDLYTGNPTPLSVPLIWDHLIYAFLIESTGVFEIFAEVLRRYGVGETLETLTPGGHRWVRATEELFFRDPPLFSVASVVSRLRPDIRVLRRNAYWRMFGLDLPHPIPSRWVMAPDQAWKQDTGSAVNTGFSEKWSELLRQIWLGFENRVNTSGPNATDGEYVAFLAKALKDMLNMRRKGGLLAREEFVHVATMSWFHLTLESDTPIVTDLKAQAESAEERLANVAQRVGMSPAPRSREFFQLADRMSGLLRAIERGVFDTGTAAETMFKPVPAPPAAQLPASQKLMEDANKIIDLWQSATGERVKDRPVTVGQSRQMQPVRIPAPTSAPVAAGGNGTKVAPAGGQ
jgi:hypothetical protein